VLQWMVDPLARDLRLWINWYKHMTPLFWLKVQLTSFELKTFFDDIVVLIRLFASC
jgi:hypothetical protein